MPASMDRNPFATAMRLVKGEDVLIVAIAAYLGAVMAAGGLPDTDLLRLAGAVAFCTLGVAGVNALNQVYDRDIDRINKPLRPIPSGILTTKQVTVIASILLACGAIIAILLGPVFVIIGVLGLGSSLLYTLPFPRFKKSMFFSTGIMGIGYGPFLLLAGWVIYEPVVFEWSDGGLVISPPLWVLLFLYFHEVFILISKDYRDIEGDKKYGMRTLPATLGKTRAAWVNYALYVSPFVGVYVLDVLGHIEFGTAFLVLSGILLGIPIFFFCSKDDQRSNVVGYYCYIFAFIMARVVLAALFIGMI